MVRLPAAGAKRQGLTPAENHGVFAGQIAQLVAQGEAGVGASGMDQFAQLPPMQRDAEVPHGKVVPGRTPCRERRPGGAGGAGHIGGIGCVAPDRKRFFQRFAAFVAQREIVMAVGTLHDEAAIVATENPVLPTAVDQPGAAPIVGDPSMAIRVDGHGMDAGPGSREPVVQRPESRRHLVAWLRAKGAVAYQPAIEIHRGGGSVFAFELGVHEDRGVVGHGAIRNIRRAMVRARVRPV